MSQITRTDYRGLLVQDPRLTADMLSATDEAGPVPGRAVASQSSSMQLDTSGTVTITESVSVRTQRGGHPVPGGVTIIWRHPTEDWRGWNAPIVPNSWECIVYDAATSPRPWQLPHAAVTSDGTVVVVACETETDTTAWTRAADGTWSSSLIETTGGYTVADGSHPTVVYDAAFGAAGRLWCWYWRELDADNYQIAMAYSDDAGDSWSDGQRDVLPEVVDTTGATPVPGRIRAARGNGQVLMLVELEDAEIRQYASDDDGATFTLIATLDTEDRTLPDVAFVGGVFVVGWLEYAATPITQPRIVRVGSAYDSIASATTTTIDEGGTMDWATYAAGAFTAAEFAMWVDTDGTVYLMGMDADDERAMLSFRSTDAGVTWTALGHGLSAATGGTWWRGDEAQVRPREVCVVPHAGRAMVIHRADSSGSGGGQPLYSLMATTLGGYSTVTMPLLSETRTDPRHQVGWSYTWLPLDFPEAGGQPWSLVSAGSPTVALAATGLVVTHTTVSDTVTWSATPATGLANGVVAFLDVEVATVSAAIDVRSSDGATYAYAVRVTITATSIVVRDLYGSTDIHTEATTYGATGVQVLVGVGNNTGTTGASNGLAAVWIRPRASAQDAKWEELITSTTITRGASTTPRVQWGTLTGAGSGLAKFRIAAYGDSTITGATPLWAGPSFPAALVGRPLTSLPVELVDGLRVAGVGGPTMRGETWTIDPRYTYAVTNLLPTVEPSPLVGWRSTTDTNDATITWELDTTVATTTRPLGHVVGLYLGRCNWRTGTLYGRTALGTWTSLATIDLADGQDSLAFTRRGALLSPSSSASSCPWYAMHELAGAHVSLGSTVHAIQTNSPGTWRTDTLPLNLVIEEPTGAASSGTAELWARDITVVLPSAGATSYGAYKLVIDAQDTAEGYFEIGVAMFGAVFPFASEYDWGRAGDIKPATDLVTTRGGGRRATVRGRARRAVELPFTAAVRLTRIAGDTPAPDWIGAQDSGTPWGVTADTPGSLMGLLDLLDGPGGLVVYLPRIAHGSSVSRLNRPAESLYGRIVTETGRLDVTQGSELINEMVRGGVLRIEEEL